MGITCWAGPFRPAIVAQPGPGRTGLLYDDGLTAFDLDFADAGRQLERIVEADVAGLVVRARIVADDFLQQHLRHRHAADARRLELEAADAVARLQHAGRRDRQPARQVRDRIEQARRFSLAAHRVE